MSGFCIRIRFNKWRVEHVGQRLTKSEVIEGLKSILPSVVPTDAETQIQEAIQLLKSNGYLILKVTSITGQMV